MTRTSGTADPRPRSAPGWFSFVPMLTPDGLWTIHDPHRPGSGLSPEWPDQWLPGASERAWVVATTRLPRPVRARDVIWDLRAEAALPSMKAPSAALSGKPRGWGHAARSSASDQRQHRRVEHGRIEHGRIEHGRRR